MPLKEGGTEKRYRCGFTASCDKQHADTITVMRDAMAGYSLERVGQFGPIAGVAQFADVTFTDDDFEVGKPFTFSLYKTRSNIATAIHGNFSDPGQQWAAVPFPPRINTDDDDAMGERLERQVDLTQVYSASQAQRVAENVRRRLMVQANGVSPLPAKFIGVQPGDWLVYDSAAHGTMDVVVKGATHNPDHSVTIVWDAITEHCFSWTTAGEQDGQVAPARGHHGTRTDLVTGFGAVGVDVVGDGGLVHSGIDAIWDPITDPTVQAVVINYRAHVPAGDWLTFNATVPSAGLAEITDGIQANTVYEVYASLIVVPLRPTGVTDIILVTSGAHHVVPKALFAAAISDLAVSLASFNAALHADYLRITGDVQRTTQRIEQTIASVSAEQDAANYLDTVAQKKLFRHGRSDRGRRGFDQDRPWDLDDDVQLIRRPGRDVRHLSDRCRSILQRGEPGRRDGHAELQRLRRAGWRFWAGRTAPCRLRHKRHRHRQHVPGLRGRAWRVRQDEPAAHRRLW